MEINPIKQTGQREFVLFAHCRSGAGAAIDLRVLDISAAGLMVERRAWNIQPEQRVLVKLEGLGYQPAIVLWVEEDKAGLQFEQPLYEPVLAHVLDGHTRFVT
jgi:hypothetical protein